MATGQTIVNRSLRLLGLINAGESPTSDESNDALTAINAMLDSWRNDRLMTYALQDETLTLVSGTSSYTIGSGGNLNTVRPVSIEDAFVRSANSDYTVTILSEKEYNGIVDKTATSNIPTYIYYEPTMATGTLKVWPVPSATPVLHLTTRVPFTALALGTTVSLPPGWEDALATNGAIAIAAEYQVQPSAAVVNMAQMALKGIKRANSRPVKMAANDFYAMFKVGRSRIESDVL